MDTKKGTKKNSIGEISAIVLAVTVFAGYVYWIVSGIPLIDIPVRQFVDSHYILSVMISLVVFGGLFFGSYRNYKKGRKLELLNLVIYIVIALMFVIYFVSD